LPAVAWGGGTTTSGNLVAAGGTYGYGGSETSGNLAAPGGFGPSFDDPGGGGYGAARRPATSWPRAGSVRAPTTQAAAAVTPVLMPARSTPAPAALRRVPLAASSIPLFSSEPRRALELAAAPRELWLAPAGLGWFLPLFGWLAPHLWLVQRLLQASALLALVGLWTRVSLGCWPCASCVCSGVRS